MHGGGDGPDMATVCLPACDQKEPTRPGDLRDRAGQPSAITGAQRIMPQYDPRSFGQGTHRLQQAISHSFVSHQPKAGEGVALRHRPFYSATMSDPETAATRLTEIHARIAKAAVLAGRKVSDVELVAISKTHNVDAIRPLIAAGQRAFGENRVQEAQAKWPVLRAEAPAIRLHLVGQLQSNKAEEAVSLFDVIHSVDRLSLITAVAHAQEKLGRRPVCFLQVNIGDEPQKGGCVVAELPNLVNTARKSGLDIVGLMAVPPSVIEPTPFFALLAKLARDQGLDQLSMGMSDDFETAIMLGATQIRIGSALFGSRA